MNSKDNDKKNTAQAIKQYFMIFIYLVSQEKFATCQ